MANMSYCRFQNTHLDLIDCVITLEKLLDNKEEMLSWDEKHASEQMYELCQHYIEIYEELKEDNIL